MGAILGGICRRCLNFPSRYGCEVSNGTRLADGSTFYGPSAHWECRAPADPPRPRADFDPCAKCGHIRGEHVGDLCGAECDREDGCDCDGFAAEKR